MVGRLGDDPAVGFLEASQHLEQGGLAGAVRAAEPHPVAVANLPGDPVEEGSDTECFGDFCELDHVRL
jgi:hypothetical protein